MATLSDRRFTTPDGAKQMETRGALSGQFADSGSDDNFIKQTREQVTQGTSALSRLTSGAVRDNFAEALKGQPFEISPTNLPKEKEDELTGGIVMLGRERREERREERHDEPAAGNAPGGAPGGAPSGGEHRYQMREKLASIGDDFWIENGAGQRVYKVDGKALRVRDTLKLRDRQGNEVAEIQEKLVTVRDTMDIARNGKTIATVKKALVTPLRGRFSVNVAGGADMDVDGNVLGHEFKVTQGGRAIAEVSKKWFRVRDAYGVDIQPGQDDALILAIAVVIDQMTSDIG